MFMQNKAVTISQKAVKPMSKAMQAEFTQGEVNLYSSSYSTLLYPTMLWAILQYIKVAEHKMNLQQFSKFPVTFESDASFSSSFLEKSWNSACLWWQ